MQTNWKWRVTFGVTLVIGIRKASVTEPANRDHPEVSLQAFSLYRVGVALRIKYVSQYVFQFQNEIVSNKCVRRHHQPTDHISNQAEPTCVDLQTGRWFVCVCR